MIIGIPKEIKEDEYRVAIVPTGVRTLASEGHTVVIEAGAGEGSGFADADYIDNGAEIVPSAADVYGASDMIMKVKEPQQREFSLLKERQILYAYLHLAAESEVTRVLLEKEIIAIAYETIELPDGSLPLLRPMSEVAGRMSVQAGAYFLQKNNGGRGVLLGGVPGTGQGMITIIGAGVVGINALKIAVGMGARVTILNTRADKLRQIDDLYGGRVTTLVSNRLNIEEAIAASDMVVGAALIPGARAPRLVTREMLRLMKKGSVLVDVSIDQGGCFETSVRTTHRNPVYTTDGILHYCVANIPGAVPETSTRALANATLPYALKIAGSGAEAAARQDSSLMKGMNTIGGRLANRRVAEALNMISSFTSL